jgi:hypothetical protein
MTAATAPATKDQAEAKGAKGAKPPKAPKAAKPAKVTAPVSTRVRIYGAGISLAFGSSFLVAGYELLNGVDAYTSCVWAFFTFFAVGLVSWLFAVTFGAALEDAAKERTKAYVSSVSEFPRHGMVESHRGLMGGVSPNIIAPSVVRNGSGAGANGSEADFQDLASLLREGADTGARGGR